MTWRAGTKIAMGERVIDRILLDEQRLAMATVTKEIIYPTSDGRPFAETDWHREVMTDLIEVLQTYYSADARV